jgi:signal transduction histidine kinase
MNNDTLNIVQLLKDVEIFSEFDMEILEEFSKNMDKVLLNKNEVLFNKGEKDNALYIILDGAVEVHDNEYVFTTLNSKQFFGEYTLIDSSVRSASVTAVQDTVLAKLPQEVFDNVTKKRPEIWKSVLITLIKRLRDYNILEEKLSKRTIEIQKKRYETEQEKENIYNQKKELEEINLTKDKFFTIIGHDLKNPFNSVIDITNTLLQDQTIDKEQSLKYIKQINSYSKNAFTLLENLLQWAKSQSGSLKINFRKYNLKVIIDDTIKLFEIKAKQKSITIISNIESELYGYFDVETITTVIRNLLSNSFKFTNSNGEININATELNDMIQIEIADNGVGISEENLQNLFKIEERTNKEYNPDKDRTGVGMILIKEFVQKNGGEIWVESELNKGTTVKFTLPKAL